MGVAVSDDPRTCDGPVTTGAIVLFAFALCIAQCVAIEQADWPAQPVTCECECLAPPAQPLGRYMHDADDLDKVNRP